MCHLRCPNSYVNALGAIELFANEVLAISHWKEKDNAIRMKYSSVESDGIGMDRKRKKKG